MRKILVIFVFSLVSIIYTKGQIPEKFSYQGVLRNSSGELIINTNISIQISLLEGSSTSTASYIEQHMVLTNSNGQFTVFIGAGTVQSGTFSAVDWSAGQIYLKTEVDESGGTNFTELGTVQLISVPYALYANDVVNKDDADASPTNELQDIILSGTNLSITNGSVVDLSVLQDGVNDADSDNTNELQTLSLVGDTLEISNGNKVTFPYDSSHWAENGSKIYYNTGNVGIGSTNPVSRLEVKGNVTSDALFQVINANNDTVFAVYPDGVKIFVDPTAKGKIGGFAVSGRSPNKAGNLDILKVTPDSTRIYVTDSIKVKGKIGGFAVSGRSPSKGIGNDIFVVTSDSTRVYVNESSTKAKVGGFAVSGRSPSKGILNDYLQVTKDSTRVYITESSVKGKLGGFAVSGRSPSKGLTQDYFNISGNTSADIIDPAEARILWYPRKEAFISGRVLVESPDSVGTNSMATGFESKSIGNYSQAFGYRARAFGDNTTAIGNNASADSSNSFALGNFAYASGKNAYALGDSAYVSTTNSYAIGAGATATGDYSFAIGSRGFDYSGDPTGKTIASGEYSYAFGMGSEASGRGAFAFGTNTLSSGFYSTALGYKTQATGPYSTSMGYNALASGLYSTATGIFTEAIGLSSFAIGYYADAIGNYSIAMGERAKASSDYSVAIGWGGVASITEASGQYSIALGYNTLASGGYSFASGRMSEASGYYSTAMGDNSTASGGYASVAIGFGATSTASGSVAIGLYPTAEGQGAFATGNHAKASSNSAISLGDYTYAAGKYSFAGGNRTDALGEGSTAQGGYSLANGNYSTAMGFYTIANSYGEHVVGMYNDTLSSSDRTSRVATDALFIIGNGTQTTNRSNAMIVKKNGEVYLPDVYEDVVGTTNRDVYIDNNGKIGYVSSSKRYKKNISSLEDVSWLYELNPVNYFYKNDKEEKLQYGLIAEDVELVNKDFVSYNKNGEVETVLYSKLISPMLKALKDQNEDNQNLKARLNNQKSRIDQLEKENQELKQKLNEIIELLNKE